MAVKLGFNFVTESGIEIERELNARLKTFERHCSSPDEISSIGVEEGFAGSIRVTVTRPRAVVDRGDWFASGPDAKEYRKIFESPTVDEVVASIVGLLERPLQGPLREGTIEEFLSNLKKIREDFHWSWEPDRGWKSERRSRERFRVCCSAKEGPAKSIRLDPVGAVCYTLTRKLYESEYWEDAARTLGLPLGIASDLIAASNDRTWKNVEGHRKPDKSLMSLRTQLIETVGLRMR